MKITLQVSGIAVTLGLLLSITSVSARTTSASKRAAAKPARAAQKAPVTKPSPAAAKPPRPAATPAPAAPTPASVAAKPAPAAAKAPLPAATPAPAAQTPASVAAKPAPAAKAALAAAPAPAAARLPPLPPAKPAEQAFKPSTRGAWTVRRNWTLAELALYGRWVAHIHERKVNGSDAQKGAHIQQILSDPSMNLLLVNGFAGGANDPAMFDAETWFVMSKANACGTLPVLLMTYYAAVRGLPVLFTRVAGKGEDIRYGEGNHPVKWLSPLDFKDPVSYVRAVCFGEPNFTTGNWRTAPDLEGTDTLPVAVTPSSVIPGLTLAYNSDGHALLVAKVESNGLVKFLDSHPDGSITTGQTLASLATVTEAVPESDRKQWYSGWRMMRLSYCIPDKAGRVSKIRQYSNQELRPFGYSDEQYRDILAMRKGQPVTIRGRATRVTNFPDYVRLKLRTHDRVDPAEMVRDWTAQLHALFTERATLVTQGWADLKHRGGIPYPDNANIYQAGGRWEQWASPSSDCDRKSTYFLGVDQLEGLVRDFDPANRNLRLSGFKRKIRTQRDLAAAILGLKEQLFASKSVSFKTARDTSVKLSLAEIEQRLFALSFDPNHPPEVRWGTPPERTGLPGNLLPPTPLASGAQLTAADSYAREQRLRYRLARKDGRTAFDDPENPTAPPRTLLKARLAPYAPPILAARATKRPARASARRRSGSRSRHARR